MARPTLITVSGQFLKVDGTPEIGTITFAAGVYTLYSIESIAQVPSRMSVALDASGNFEIDVPATDDPAWAPVDWTYTLIIKLANDYSIYEVSIPYDSPGGNLSLGELIPSGSGSGPIDPGNYAPLVHTHSGEQITSGTIAVARLPVGSTGSTVAVGNHTHAGGGTGTPATTVVAETTYGQSSAVGTSELYARGDHTHGSPALPTPGDIGAATSSHAHNASDINAGTLAIARIPTGTSGTTVPFGNDSRFSDARTPTAHAASHASAGSDPVTLAQSQITSLTSDLAAKAPLASPTFTGTVSGVTKAMVGLGNVDNTSDAAKPVSTATQTALDGKLDEVNGVVTDSTFTITKSDGTSALRVRSSGGAVDVEKASGDVVWSTWDGATPFTGTQANLLRMRSSGNTLVGRTEFGTGGYTSEQVIDPVTGVAYLGNKNSAGNIGLAGYLNASGPPSTGAWDAGDVLAFNDGLYRCSVSGTPGTWARLSPAFPVTSVAGKTGDVTLVKSDVGLANVDNTSDASKPVSTATQTALDLKANIASPTFTGTVSGITKSMVGLGNVDNTSDATKDAATATLTNKTLASPAFTGTPTGLTKSHVGLSNVDNTADSAKPVSTATQTALDGKPDVYAWNGSAYVLVTTGDIYIGPGDPGTVGSGSIWIDTDA